MKNKKIYFRYPSIHPYGALRTTLRYIFEDKNTQGERKTYFPRGPQLKRSENWGIKGCGIKLILLINVFISVFINAQNTQVITIISPRSQGFDTPRVISGWDTVSHCPTKDNFIARMDLL
jgi:hypothetical protein